MSLKSLLLFNDEPKEFDLSEIKEACINVITEIRQSQESPEDLGELLMHFVVGVHDRRIDEASLEQEYGITM